MYCGYISQKLIGRYLQYQFHLPTYLYIVPIIRVNEYVPTQDDTDE